MGLDQENDNVIWAIAKQQDYIIVTKDSDFNELLILKGFPPKVIWIRLGNSSTQMIESLLRDNYEMICNFSQDASLGIITLR
jgi:predicted nuclease of predicted toxin-antitoxin system